MGGRFGKYGDLSRKAALRKSREEKGRLQKGGKMEGDKVVGIVGKEDVLKTLLMKGE